METTANTSARRLLAGAFREATWGLMGLFELYDVEPELVEAAAETLSRIYHAHAQGPSTRPRAGDMQRLLKKLNQEHTATHAA
jgi:hypothetical protein